jgi:hypothetical protein
MIKQTEFVDFSKFIAELTIDQLYALRGITELKIHELRIVVEVANAK